MGERRIGAGRPPGCLVDVGGRRLHYLFEGEHNAGPTVVLDTGLGGNVLSWELVAPAVSSFARTLRFDRPGLGWSDAAPHQPTATAVARDLYQLLECVRIPGPYVLVGWSLGALHMCAFAALYADDVAGLVLVDPNQESMPAIPGHATAPKKVTMAETRALSASRDEVCAMQSALPFPDVPLLVITSDDPVSLPITAAPWQLVHADLVERSSTSRKIIAGGSGHLIPINRPDVVIEAIREIIMLARSASGGPCKGTT